MRLPLSVLIIAAFTQIGATEGCGGGIIKDPGFELWCGAELCSWKLVRGEVREVATWHTEDSGVELIGNDAAIAQLSAVARSDGPCIRFELLANVDEDVEARLELDISGDGSIDHSERMPTSKWKPLSYKLHIPGQYSGIRFILSKQGPGRAVFAQIQANIDYDGCAGLPAIESLPSPLGAPCSANSGCESRICDDVPDPDAWFGTSKQCVGCTDTTCGTGQVCGRGEALTSVLDVPVLCVAAGADELGEQCQVDGECASNICEAGVCSTCMAGGGCGGTDSCGLAYPLGPSVCGPGLRHRAANEPCATNGDCTSNQCNGAVRKQCSDGRPCDDPGDCPVESGLEHGACTVVGIQGGRCQ